MGLSVRVTLVDCILSGPNGLTYSRCTGTGPPLGKCHVPFQSGDGETRVHILVLKHEASTMSIWLGGGGLQQGKSKDKYSNRHRIEGVK